MWMDIKGEVLAQAGVGLLTQGTSVPFLGRTEAGVSVPGDSKDNIIISFIQVELFPIRCRGWLELGAKSQATGLQAPYQRKPNDLG